MTITAKNIILFYPLKMGLIFNDKAFFIEHEESRMSWVNF